MRQGHGFRRIARSNPNARHAFVSEEQLDTELVARAQKGDARAFELLVRKYQSRIVSLAERLVGDSDAQDVAQESFIKAHRALKGFKGDAQFFTWLYRITVNTAKNYLVARRRRPATQDVDAVDAEQFGHTLQMSDNDTPERLLLSAEIQTHVTQAIAKLPSDLRQAISLRELDGLSYEEIADIMECPIGTVRSRIFRAREAIDVVLKPLVD